MRRMLLSGAFALGGLAVLASGLPARAIAIAMPPPGPDRAVRADAVVVGRVVALEDKDIQVGGVTYRIAAVSVTEAIKGTKAKQIRVGFIPQQGGIGIQPGGPIRPGRRPFPGNMQYTVGQDGLFFLSKGPEGKFFTTPGFGMFISSQDGNFKKEVGDAKVAITVGDNPTKFLKSEKAEERLFAASVLIQKYRQTPHPKAEPIPAEESKLILKALAKADWNVQQDGRSTHPWTLFNQLGLTAKDGWDIQKLGRINDVRDYYKAAQAWLTKNADTYRIQKNVGVRPVGPGGRPIDLPIRIQPGQPGQIQPLPIQIQPLPVQPNQGGGQGQAGGGVIIRPGIRVQQAQPAQPPQPAPDRPLD